MVSTSPALPQSRHAIGRRADARQNHVTRRTQTSPGSVVRSESTPRRSIANCSDAMLAPPLSMMASSAHHSVPFVLGSSVSVMRNRLPQRASDAFEAGFDHVMRVLAGHLEVDGRAERFRQRAEEMRHEFGRQLSDLIATELTFENEVGSTRQIDGDLRERLVHRQQEAIAMDAALVAERRFQRLAQRQRAVLDGVMLVDVQIAGARQLQRKAAVLRDLFEHVIEEAQAGRHLDRRFLIEVDLDRDVGFFRLAASTRACARRGRESRGDLWPGLRALPARTRKPSMPRLRASSRSVSRSPMTKLRVAIDRVARADSHRADRCAACGRRSRPSAKCGQMNSASNVMPCEASSVAQEFMRLAECGFGEARGPETVLIADHHERVAGIAQIACSAGHDAGHQPQLLQAVDLLIRRLDDQRAVAIDEEHASLRTHAAAPAACATPCAAGDRSVLACRPRCAGCCASAGLRTRIANDQADRRGGAAAR